MKNFPTPHCHIQSLDSASTPERFAQRELELGTGHITVTDHGTLEATREAYDLCCNKKQYQGLSPILGLEGYFRDDDCPILKESGVNKDADGTFRSHIKYNHITLHALDEKAYSAISRLLSNADLRAEKHGSERKPLFNWQHLEELGSHNVTATSGCLIGMVGRHLLKNSDPQVAVAYYEKLRSIFKPGNFYVEIFPHVCDRNWESKVVITDTSGRTHDFFPYKKLRLDKGEMKAEELAALGVTKARALGSVRAIMNQRVWTEINPIEIKEISRIEGFVQNECLPWATDGDVQAGVNKFLLRLAARYKDPVLISDDSHFAFPKEKVIQDIRLAQHGGSWRFANSHHRMDSAEAWTYFEKVLGISRATFDGWVDNNISWAARFKDFRFSKRNTLPVSFYPKDTYAHTLNLIKQHGRMDWDNTEYVDRLNKEFDLLHRNGTIDLLPYFFIDEEVCRAYAKNNLLTGPGRGSAAGLLLSYLLGITHVDPIKYKLSMDRFLTLDRIQTGKFPDIDQDLENRDFLIGPEGSEGTGWIYQRFGKCVAQISTNTTIKLKSAILDTFRARFGKVPDHIAEFSKNLPPPPQGISDADYVFGFKDTDEVWQPGLFETHTGLQEFAKNHPEEWGIIKMLLGLPRNKGRHACALVISDEPIENFIPLQTIGGVRATAFTHSQVEAAGGLKMDFLRVNSLRDISAALKLIRQKRNVDLTSTDSDGIKYAIIDEKKVYEVQILPFEEKLYDIWNLPERKEVFEDICKGNVATVFQLDAGAARQGLRSFMPVNGVPPLNSIQSLSAFTALDRPGPLDAYIEQDGKQVHNMLVEYANRAKGLAPIGEMPVLTELIPETFGIIVYQEQLQAIFQSIGGTTAIEANNFRNRISKKKMVDVNRIDKPLFMKGAVPKVGQSTAEGLWAQMETFGQYGFNASHAVAYMHISYATAFLKHFYPLEWWTAVLSNADRKEIDEKFWRYCGHLIKLPDIQYSGPQFLIEGDSIRAPLWLMAGIGEKAHQQLMEFKKHLDTLGRKATITDLLTWIEEWRLLHGTPVTTTHKKTGQPVTKIKKAVSSLNTTILQNLIISGSLDSLFPDVDYLGMPMDVEERLKIFAFEFANINGSRKFKNLATVYNTQSKVVQFQLRKKVLPAFTDNIAFAVRSDKPELFDKKTYTSEGKRWFVLDPADYERLATMPVLPDRDILVAVVGYVTDVRIFEYTDKTDGTRKRAAEVTVESNGHRTTMVKWPSKAHGLPPVFTKIEEGSVVSCLMSRTRGRKGFFFVTADILVPPLGAPEPDEETPQ